MNIILKPQTVLTMIGPSHSGKSTISKQIKDYLASQGKTCTIIESDSIRKELLHLDQNAEIPNSAGFAVSEVAFKKLRADLNFYMSHPVNTDVIIIDTTGLDRQFREDICNQAKTQGYANMAMIFQLNKSTLFGRVYGEETKVNFKRSYIERQLTRLKEKVLPYFNKHDYMQTYRIDDKKLEAMTFEYQDNTRVLNIDSGKFAIYGDVHQQYKELEILFEKASAAGFVNHLLIGDYIDKDDEESLKKTLDFVYRQCNAGKMRLIRANHEEYVYRHLKDPSYVYEENDETQYFTSLKYLLKEENELYRNMFFDLFENFTYDYAKVENDRNYAYITHSPCDEMHLGKHSPKSLKMMRNTRFFSEEGKESIELMGPILEQSASNKALHIFGHVEVGIDFHTYRNKLAIDCGCVSGGHLVACLYDVDIGKKEFISQETLSKEKKKLLDFSVHIKQWTNRVELSPAQERQHRRLIKANPAFISGTVSPSPSTIKGDISLESVDSAIKLFKDRGITEVIAQKKHMGSRCQVYLFKNREDCYATSRNGYKIGRPEIEAIIDREYEKYQGKYEHLLITDNELMPWSFLGKGLISDSFMPYYHAVNTDIQMLQKSGLKEFVGYSDETFVNIEKFNKQVEIYGAEVEGYVETFGIIYKDGKHLLTANQEEVLTEFGIGFEKFDLNSETDCERLNKFYTDMIADGVTEGICIKPMKWNKDDIPCIKVRNSEYLRIVYGFDYTSTLRQHAEGKNIRGKLNLSIKEQNLNLMLLDAYSKEDKDTQKEIYASLLTEFEKEAGLDPRL